jgi:hypothetical protein
MPISQVSANMLGVSSLPGVGAGQSANLGIAVYEQTSTLAISFAITTGTNAFSFGPITVADGVTIVVPDGTIWSVI